MPSCHPTFASQVSVYINSGAAQEDPVRAFEAILGTMKEIDRQIQGNEEFSFDFLKVLN